VVQILIILNEPAYGNERSYNGLRLARNLVKSEGVELRLFLMGDAVTVAMRGQKTPDGYYNLESMLRPLSARRAAMGACGTCLEARGIEEEALVDGAHRSSMAELTDWTLWADKVIVF
jgi:uncharacterized protein involved in oxidation of intracellular sulfur